MVIRFISKYSNKKTQRVIEPWGAKSFFKFNYFSSIFFIGRKFILWIDRGNSRYKKLLNLATNVEWWVIQIMTHSQVERVRKLPPTPQTRSHFELFSEIRNRPLPVRELVQRIFKLHYFYDARRGVRTVSHRAWIRIPIENRMTELRKELLNSKSVTMWLYRCVSYITFTFSF